MELIKDGKELVAADSERQSWNCSICNQVFEARSVLKIHYRIHTDECPYVCSHCEAEYRFKVSLQIHIRLKHRHTSDATKDEANSETISTSGDTPIDKPKVPSLEQADGASKSDAVKTERTTTTKEKSPRRTKKKVHRCPICGMYLKSNTSLIHHERLHTGERPHKCETCGRRFIQKAYLKVHNRVHTGEKKFSCPLCSRRFSHKAFVGVHMRRHTGEQPFACTFCPERFGKRSDYRQHTFLHTGEKPAKCSKCPARFRLKRQLQKHQFRIHKIRGRHHRPPRDLMGGFVV